MEGSTCRVRSQILCSVSPCASSRSRRRLICASCSACRAPVSTFFIRLKRPIGRQLSVVRIRSASCPAAIRSASASVRREADNPFSARVSDVTAARSDISSCAASRSIASHSVPSRSRSSAVSAVIRRSSASICGVAVRCALSPAASPSIATRTTVGGPIAAISASSRARSDSCIPAASYPLESLHRMGLLHSLLGAVGLASAGEVRTAQQRATDLKRAVADSREEAARWKAKANELSAKLSDAEHATERLPKVERQLNQWKQRDEMHAAKLAEVRERMRRAERAAALSQEHLIATETKLDIVEAALGVLDRRTRRPL